MGRDCWATRSPRAVLAAALWAALPAAAAPGDPVAGRKVFAACVSCHQVGPSARSSFGPQLNGIVGRRAGGLSDYRYSAAMRGAGFVWTEERLAAFIRSPAAVVPGTSMRYWGGGLNERRLADLLAYLRQPPAPTPR